MSLTKNQLKEISTIFINGNDKEKCYERVLALNSMQNWTIPKAQLGYMSDVLTAFDNDVDKAYKRLEEDGYIAQLKTFMPGVEKIKAPVRKTPKKPKKKTVKETPEKNENKNTETSKSNQIKSNKITMVREDAILERITDYWVIKAAVTEGLQIEVKKAMKLGWIPYGGLGVDRAGIGGVAMGQMTYFQVMIKLKG